MEEQYQGQIVNLNEKGYGFIKVEGKDKNVFFHAKDLRHISFDQIRKGDLVAMESLVETEKGFNAKNVFLIS